MPQYWSSWNTHKTGWSVGGTPYALFIFPASFFLSKKGGGENEEERGD
jgi:hypothetical protein